MNTYQKFCPNVFVAKCTEEHEKGETITVTTKHGKENECIVHNLVRKGGGFFFYSITREDGFDAQERARRKAEKYSEFAASAAKKSTEFYNRSNKDADFLSLGEPIKVGHHSEKRHRKMLEEANSNMMKSVEFEHKAEEHEHKSDYWERKAEEINLSMPESIEYYKEKLETAKQYHEDMKNGKIPRTHAYSLTYAKKAVNDMQKNYNLAVQLWG